MRGAETGFVYSCTNPPKKFKLFYIAGVYKVYSRSMNLCLHTAAWYWFEIKSVVYVVTKREDDNMWHLAVVTRKQRMTFDTSASLPDYLTLSLMWRRRSRVPNRTAGTREKRPLQIWTCAAMTPSQHTRQAVAAAMLELLQRLIKSVRPRQFHTSLIFSMSSSYCFPQLTRAIFRDIIWTK